MSALLYLALVNHGLHTCAATKPTTLTVEPSMSLIGKQFDGYRLWTTGASVTYWIVTEIEFYGNLDCTGPVNNDGEPVSSGYFSENFAPKNAFDSDETTQWDSGCENVDKEHWIGMEYDTPREVMCISYVNGDDYYYNGYFAMTIEIQGKETSTGLWIELMTVNPMDSTSKLKIILPVYSLPPSVLYLSSVLPSESTLPSMKFKPSSTLLSALSAVPSKEPSEAPPPEVAPLLHTHT